VLAYTKRDFSVYCGTYLPGTRILKCSEHIHVGLYVTCVEGLLMLLCMYAAACTLALSDNAVVPLYVCRVCWCLFAGVAQQVHKGEEVRALDKTLYGFVSGTARTSVHGVQFCSSSG
jgi:hypothetical protein